MVQPLAFHSDLLTSPAARHWSRIGLHAHHGICLPLFSLHSSQSNGIGDFLDLIPLIDWCAEIGLDVIQLLPLNDSGPDPSPYSAISAFALHPNYLNLTALPNAPPPPQIDLSKRLDYHKVWKLKSQYLREDYAAELDNLAQSNEFAIFASKYPWLDSYAQFKAQKERYDWKEIPPYNPSSNAPSLKKTITQHKVIQYLCFQQMEAVKAHASRKGILLKGDLPILISRNSADTWAHQHYFDSRYSAGAPPDMYHPGGQNWGFPIYDWEQLKAEDYHWWKLRLDVAERFYHLYRLDHVVGFYRIWAIPLSPDGGKGLFLPTAESEWIPQGEQILKMLLEHSDLLPIGEDLGVIPPAVRKSLHRLGIPGTKVLRWEREWNKEQQFIDPNDFSPISLTTVSTHDSETLAQWWRSQRREAEAYCQFKDWTYTSELPKEKALDILRDSHQSASLFHINLLQEYLWLVPGLHWQNPEDDRINVPGTVGSHNWTYRIKPCIEEITSNQDLAQAIQGLIRK